MGLPVILHDFNCETCDIRFEALVGTNDTETVHADCGTTAARVMSAPHIGTMNNPATQAAALQKRSYDHTVKEARANQDGLAAKMGGSAKPRAQAKWNIRDQSKTKKSS